MAGINRESQIHFALTCASGHAPFRAFPISAFLRDFDDARLSHPHLRRPAARGPGRKCAPLRLGASQARDHGGLLFVDLRDHYGLTQLVVHPGTPGFEALDSARAESVVRIDGEVVARDSDTINPARPTGEIEIRVGSAEVLSQAAELPLPVFGEPEYPEEIRLSHRYLDLRRETLHKNIVLALPGDRSDPPAHGRPGLHRVSDADPHRLQP